MNNKNINIECQIYCDMDGCLVDFEGGVVSLGNQLVDMMRYQDFSNQDNLKLENYDNKYEYNFYKLMKKLYDQDNGFKEKYTFKDFENRNKGEKAFRELIYSQVSVSEKWWVNLGWAPKGKELWDYICTIDLPPKILSSPIGPISAKGKRVWCKRHLNVKDSDVIIVDHKNIELDKSKINILIDDMPKRLEEFTSFGGFGVLHITGDLENTKEQIKRIIGE